MANPSESIVEVTDFQRDVIERSHERPVLVDFWADWCMPCRVLSPTLERVAREYAGALVLAKVDTEVHREAAMMYQVRSIPDVRLFVNGEVVAGFVGALPEARVREFLHQHCPSEARELAREGARLLQAGDIEAAQDALERAVELEPSLDEAHLELARLALRRHDPDAVAEHVSQIRPAADAYEPARHLLDAAALLREAEAAGSQAALEARLQTDADDLEARYGLAAYHLAAGRHRDALEHYLGVAERQRKWRDEAPRKAMLTAFGIIGVRHPLSDEFRKKLMFIY